MAPLTLLLGSIGIDIFYLIGVPFFSFLAQYIFTRYSDRITSKKRKEKEQDEAKKKKAEDDNCSLKAGVKSLLRDRLRRNFLFYKEKGCIDIADKENFHALYVSYHELGGNGMVDEMYSQVMDLPLPFEHKEEQNKK